MGICKTINFVVTCKEITQMIRFQHIRIIIGVCLFLLACQAEVKKKKNPPRHFFCSIEEVIHGHQAKWLFNNKGVSSAIFTFPKDSTPLLTIHFSPQCKISYPYQIEKDRILVKWINQPITDSIHEIMSLIKRYNSHYHNKNFMRISLLNDTTLRIKYTHENLRNTLNAGSNERILFPDRVYLRTPENRKNINYHLITSNK